MKITTKNNKTQIIKRRLRTYMMPKLIKGFKNKIATHLKQRGYTRPELTATQYEQIGCTRQQFELWIGNKEQPRIDQLVVIGIILNEPLQNLYTYAQ